MKWSVAATSLLMLFTASFSQASNFSNTEETQDINRIVIFGDSLSDTGKMFKKMHGYLPAAPNYYNGRFSNGPVWTDLVGGLLDKKLPMINEAEGGATAYDHNKDSKNPTYDVINNLDFEVKQFESKNKFNPDDLVIIWLGANDYLAYRWNKDSDAEHVLDSIFQKIGYLSVKGVKHIMLVNLPDLGTSPQARLDGITREETHVSKYHNKRLAEVVGSLYDPSKVKVFDIAQEFEDIMKYPQDYGMQDTVESCFEGGYWWKPFAKKIDKPINLRRMQAPLSASQERQIAANPLLNQASAEYANEYANSYTKTTCTGHLFWDKVHPTKEVHRILASKMANFINTEFLENNG